MELRGVVQAMSITQHSRSLRVVMSVVVLLGGLLLYARLFAGNVQQRVEKP